MTLRATPPAAAQNGALQPFNIVENELAAVEDLLLRETRSQSELLTESASCLILAGGKRLRPMFAVLASMFGEGPTEDVRLTAAALEVTHLATLYHDDIIDEADVRRGVPTANVRWGNQVAVRTGDYLLAIASALAAQVGRDVAKALAEAIGKVVRGQIIEIEKVRDLTRTREHYFRSIRGKTAALLEVSARLGASLGGCPHDIVAALSAFAMWYGIAFQIVDDLMDLLATEMELGKEPGIDLRDGVYTLPVIHALRVEPELAELLRAEPIDLKRVRARIVASGGLEETQRVLVACSDRALSRLSTLPAGPHRDAFTTLAEALVRKVCVAPTPHRDERSSIPNTRDPAPIG